MCPFKEPPPGIRSNVVDHGNNISLHGVGRYEIVENEIQTVVVLSSSCNFSANVSLQTTQPCTLVSNELSKEN